MKKNNKKIKIAVIGLGYVGLPIAIELSKFFKVYGYDKKKQRVRDLVSNVDQTHEIESKVLRKTKVIFSDQEKILENVNVFIVTIPTPVNKNNIPDLRLLKESTRTISKYIKKNSLIVYESTVYPGCTEEVCLPILKENKKFEYNKDFFIGYSPERINPGDKKRNVSNITKVISGSSSEAVENIKFIYSKIVKTGVHIAPSIKIAEAAKIIENTQRDLNIGLMNELFMLFDKLNIPTEEILRAAGTKWNFLKFKPGLVGGHCIGVDPYYLTHKCKQINFKPKIILSGRNINDNFHKFIGEKTLKIIKKQRLSKKILVLGYSFKENCPDYRNTRVFHLVKFLKKKKCEIDIHDPYLLENKNNFPFQKLALKDLKECKKKFDLILLVVPHDFYLKNQKLLLNLLSKKGLIYDFKSSLKKNFKVIQN
jgi:UDP-N-acetyl-D-galactosamine dehydrogenase